MNSNNEAEKRVVVEIRIRGESDQRDGHNWAYLQIWDEEAAIQFLQSHMRKSDQDAQLLLKSYDSFRVELTIKPQAVAERETTHPNEALVRAE